MAQKAQVKFVLICKMFSFEIKLRKSLKKYINQREICFPQHWNLMYKNVGDLIEGLPPHQTSGIYCKKIITECMIDKYIFIFSSRQTTIHLNTVIYGLHSNFFTGILGYLYFNIFGIES